jgi:transposase-like protein
MSQHFLLSAAAKTLTLAGVMRMTDAEAEAFFKRLRWPETNGEPYCSKCGCTTCYDCRRASGLARWECKACGAGFSITGGTLFASRKLPLRAYLAAIAVAMNEVKGKNALALSRDLGISYKAAFVLLHKLREAMGSALKADEIGGDGKVAEIDGGYFGGYIKPANHRANRKDRRYRQNQSGKRECVVIIRERGGSSVPAVFRHEGQALDFIRSRIAKGTIVNADEASTWNDLSARYEMRRINHQEAYSLDGACTNWAEEYFSRLRRAEIGHHHHVAGPYLLRYAQESAWREDHRRLANGEQVKAVTGLALNHRPSADFCGYWQRHQPKAVEN